MHATDLLKSKGLKKTALRIMLINMLYDKGIALTEEEIKAGIGELYDRITFYRTIQTLLDAGLIHRITIDNKTNKYALNDICGQGKYHAHFFCTCCHSVTCLPEHPVPGYVLPVGFKATGCELLVKGTCNHCVE